MSKDKKTQSFTVSGLKYLMDQDKLNFEPIYQRGYVWNNTQKQLFIDSVFLDYDVPKIYFHDNPREDEGKKPSRYDVVDGQQRLKTIQEFLSLLVKLPQDSDPINGEEIKSKNFDQISDELQQEFLNRNIDVVVLNSEYDSDDIEDMFLRYQNGEPLNAAEKRKAIPGLFRKVVADLATHPVFDKQCGFNNKREAYQDAAAKILHIRIANVFKSITPASIRKTYEDHSTITDQNKHVKEVKKTLNFIASAFSASTNSTPKLKKFAILTLAEVIHHLLENYAVSNFKKEIADSYLNFEKNRAENQELDEQSQAHKFSAYTDAARGDSPAQQELRYKTLLKEILLSIPSLETKDPNRQFSEFQKQALYMKYEGVCQSCNKDVEYDDYHADHIKPHSQGGVTKLENGQLLCANCNLKKGAN